MVEIIVIVALLISEAISLYVNNQLQKELAIMKDEISSNRLFVNEAREAMGLTKWRDTYWERDS